MAQGETQGGSTQGQDISMLLGIVMVMIAIPLAIQHFVLPYYAAYWYYPKYYVFKGLWYLTQNEFTRYLVELPYVWVKFIMWDVSIRPNGLSELVTDCYYKLQEVEFDTLKQLSTELYNGTSMREEYIPLGRLYFAIICPLYLWILSKLFFALRKVDMHRTVFSLDSFALRMSGCIPQLLPVVYVNPQLELDLDKGPWRMSPKVFDYMKQHNCLLFDEDDRFSLKERETTELLVSQLGDRWSGFENLPINYYRIAAITLPMVVSPATGKRETDKLIEEFCVGFSSKPHFSTEFRRFMSLISSPRTYLKGGWKDKVSACYADLMESRGERQRQQKALKAADKLARQYVAKYGAHDKVTSVLRKHAYEITTVSALIEAARTGGVLPSCNCLWLKPLDRTLFYAFNNLGRDVCWVEVTGFWSHYLTEQTIGVPFPYPKVQSGLAGIDEYFESSFYIYDPIVRD